MSLDAHIKALQEKRNTIKELISKEMSYPAPDFDKIYELKKQNLTIKEKLGYFHRESEMAAAS